MRTDRIALDRWNPDPSVIERAGALLREGRLVAFPTETVYGLGANGLDPGAVKKIFLAKGRPSDNPLILHLCDPRDARSLARVDARAEAVMEAFWPGPLTLVLPALPVVPAEVTAGLETVALRMPDHPVALSLIGAAGCPVAGPSANRSGRPSPTDADAVMADLDGRVDLVLDAGAVEVGVESTVLDLTGERAVLLRPGGMSVERIAEFFGEEPGVADKNSARRSPGTRYRHYAPAVPVHVWHGEELRDIDPATSGFIGLDLPRADFARAIVFDSSENFARGIFAGFRRMEADGVLRIVVQWPDARGIGLALRDRIRRASEDRSPENRAPER
ncbi:MAG: threonylcarbamoyl-AMP synthase [Synergistaceae bacterium]|jgi:L-threonylcarbamoyladenylate synthase|nr:threonylcarbamoyl-AMP synthase [Synergistaceae bacterium]